MNASKARVNPAQPAEGKNKMSTTVTQYSQDQIRTNFNAAIEMLKPAVLKNTPEDRLFIERLITQQMLAKQLEPTAENFYSVFTAIFAVLPWRVKPAKLILLEKSAAPATLESSVKLNEQRAKVVADAEAAEKYAKEQSDYAQLALGLVDAFLPMNKRGGIDHRKMGEVQTKLRDHIAKEKARGCSMKAVHKIVVDEIQRQYAQIERANERL